MLRRWPLARPDARPWSTTLVDPQAGRVAIRGLLDDLQDARALVVVVHGLGGRATTAYCARAARAARRAGFSSLRMWVRGADRLGEDFAHAGLTADLDAVLASPEARRHEKLFVLGYSLGGHLALRHATESPPAALAAVAAICPPLDLAETARVFDEEVAWPYRRWVLSSMKDIYAQVARRRAVPTPVPLVRRTRTVREWDALAVVPRHGFSSVADYYEKASVAPRLGDLRVPALLVATRHDPMVPARVIEPALPASAPGLDVRWFSRGGHLGFPLDTDLGEPGRLGLEDQVMAWLARRGGLAPT
jgi:predicted alpha/beta-fold hydrolase